VYSKKQRKAEKGRKKLREARVFAHKQDTDIIYLA
jgi:hypothetical protein